MAAPLSGSAMRAAPTYPTMNTRNDESRDR
jgi:hypothetical protein